MHYKVNHTKTEKLLLEAARVFNSTLDYEELIPLILKLVMKAVGSEAAMSFRVDKNRSDMKIRFLGARDENLFTCSHQPGQGVTSWVADYQEAVIINDPSKDERIDYDLRKKCGVKIRSLLSVPLIGKGQLIGVIEAINKIDAEFTEEDLDVLIGLSNQIAVAIDNANLYRQVKREVLEKNMLYEIGKALSGSLKLDEVLQQILISFKQVVQLDAGWVFVIDPESKDIDSIASVGYTSENESQLHIKMGQGLVGDIAKSGKSEIVPDVSKDSRYVSCGLKTKSELVVPIKVDGRVIGVLNIESETLDAYNARDLSLIEAFASQAGISIERARLHQQSLDNRKLQEQLTIARDIQQSFLPKSNPLIDGYDIFGCNISSEQVGGDYFDFVKIDEKRTGITIGDVSGKGVPAALIMSALKATLIAQIRNNFSPAVTCQKVNDQLVESIAVGNFVTLVYGELNSEDNSFTYVNCGHNLPVLLKANGEIEYLREGGQIIGMTANTDYSQGVVKLESGDILFLYTDGVTEVFDASENEFGLKRVEKVLKANGGSSAKDIQESILREIRKFASKDQKFDDITTVVVKKL